VILLFVWRAFHRVRADTPRVNRIYEFIEKSGWIAAPAATATNKKTST
jgi:hypothetical protein